ncbi:MAG: cytochrome c [Planctomycetales bacterium]|nr:cytochrome c [Planctomycetales bacterium]MCA9206640.1 cytochrome c [Planctomycetales bacterium]MCA9210443.1 cytochrome c [Planctomycetales bacterium]MCA9220552.1 cytochrome c [Planctomycetales bacterium]
MFFSKRSWLLCALLLLMPVCWAVAQTGGKTVVRRAKWPKFDKRATQSVFLEDVFSKLEGERPANLVVAAKPAGGKPSGGGAAGASADVAPTGEWASIISPTTIEDEVKALKLVVDEAVTTPGKFAGNDYKTARREFSVLAMLFAIINTYDGDVRWKDQAAASRDVFARTAANAKVGTSQVYNEAKLRKQELQDLIGGAALPDRPASAQNDWSQICDRGPLMQRLETSLNTKLQPWTSNKAEFAKHSEELFHEAEITAAISAVLAKPGMEDGEDEDYAAFAKTMQKAARDIVDAVKLNNAEQASSAVGVINKACSECHELYRSS